nr:ligase-associated DNA damage response endonuclease PdeM [Pseudovibrio flavus]
MSLPVPVCHDVSIGNETVGLHDGGALWWPEEHTLVVSDLHMEKGASFARRGQMLPPYDTGATLERLSGLITIFQPKRVIALGDSFHDEKGADCLPAAYRAMLKTMQIGREWVWITGNHDKTIPASYCGDVVETLQIRSLTFCHEPSEGVVSGEICGHLHPAAKVRRKGRSIRRPCFATDGRRLVLPAFGALTGGLNVLDAAWQPVFSQSRFSVFMLGTGRLYPFAASKLTPDTARASAV